MKEGGYTGLVHGVPLLWCWGSAAAFLSRHAWTSSCAPCLVCLVLLVALHGLRLQARFFPPKILGPWHSIQHFTDFFLWTSRQKSSMFGASTNLDPLMFDDPGDLLLSTGPSLCSTRSKSLCSESGTSKRRLGSAPSRALGVVGLVGFLGKFRVHLPVPCFWSRKSSGDVSKHVGGMLEIFLTFSSWSFSLEAVVASSEPSFHHCIKGGFHRWKLGAWCCPLLPVAIKCRTHYFREQKPQSLDRFKAMTSQVILLLYWGLWRFLAEVSNLISFPRS